MSQLPNKKQSAQELNTQKAKIAMGEASSAAPSADYYSNSSPKRRVKSGSRPLATFGYVCAFSAPGWLFIRSFSTPLVHTTSDVAVVALFLLLAIGLALFIMSKRKLSKHHGSFILIITFFCFFSLVSVMKSEKEVYRQMMAVFGVEVPEELEIKSERVPVKSLEVERLERMIERERSKSSR